jgi:hypothetical protein
LKILVFSGLLVLWGLFSSQLPLSSHFATAIVPFPTLQPTTSAPVPTSQPTTSAPSNIACHPDYICHEESPDLVWVLRKDGNVQGPACKEVCSDALCSTGQHYSCDDTRAVPTDFTSFSNVTTGLGFTCSSKERKLESILTICRLFEEKETECFSVILTAGFHCWSGVGGDGQVCNVFPKRSDKFSDQVSDRLLDGRFGSADMAHPRAATFPASAQNNLQINDFLLSLSFSLTLPKICSAGLKDNKFDCDAQPGNANCFDDRFGLGTRFSNSPFFFSTKHLPFLGSMSAQRRF